MIKINNTLFEPKKFPDGTFLLNFDPEKYVPNLLGADTIVRISWQFESNEELVLLMFITKHLKNMGVSNIQLMMPYIPNARQDRVKTAEDVFTLKYFAEFINSLGFSEVIVFDPHSYVSEALIDRIVVMTPEYIVQEVVNQIYNDTNNEPLMAFFPDEGAMKRYNGMLGMPYAFGIKNRNWRTGEIKDLSVAGETDLIKERNVLIIDDICSKGGTFYYSAKKLKELGAKKIYLYVSHCEKSIFDGQVFTSGLIDKVFTTDSIFVSDVKDSLYADKLNVMKYKGGFPHD